MVDDSILCHFGIAKEGWADKRGIEGIIYQILLVDKLF